ncbi:hypothetical protein E8E14_007586 [Neopestalotiopsis sp. 37M]|nr:hypothetical protein E8E14_007586 [Neopestalotiopsis sp. 37M]
MQPMTSPVPSPFPMNQQMNQPTWTSMSHTPQSQQTFVTMPGVGNHYMVPDNQVLSSANFSAMMNGPQTHQDFVAMPSNGSQHLTPGNLSPTMEAGGMSPRDESLAGLVPDLWDQNLPTFDSQQQGYFPFPPDQQVTPTTSGHSRSMSLDMMSVNIASTPFSGVGSPIEAIPPSFGQAVGSTPQMSNHLPGHHRNLSAPAMIPDHVSECTCVQSGLNTLSRVTSMVANHELSYHDFMIENQSVCQAWTTVLQCPRCMGASLQRCMALSFLEMCFQQQMRSFQTLVEGLRPGPVNMAMPESDQWTQIFQDLQQALTDLNQAWLEMRQLITPEIAEYDFFASALVNNAWRALDRSASMLQTKKSQLSAPLSASGLPVRLKRH